MKNQLGEREDSNLDISTASRRIGELLEKYELGLITKPEFIGAVTMLIMDAYHA